jgi:DNA-binding NtrC family response regulator
MSRTTLLEKLRRAAALRQLPEAELESLTDPSRVRELAPGDTLFDEGDPGSSVFVTVGGSVAIRKQIDDEMTATIALRGEGEWIGEMALLDDAGRSASAVAESRLRVLEIQRGEFLTILGNHPEAALDLLRSISQRLRQSDAALVDVVRKRANELVATNRRLSDENRALLGSLDREAGFEAFVGSSKHAGRIREAALRAASQQVPVLLSGEPGTGKNLLAGAIHVAGARAAAPFLSVHCGLLSESVLESELFGHAPGALPGTTEARRGLVELARGGTLFLDAVAEMPRALQGVLLRFLEVGEYQRVGETRVRSSEVRTIAATDVDLGGAVREGHFRPELRNRLEAIRIAIPPLRRRRQDIPLLAAHLMEQIAERLGAEPLDLAPATLRTLSRHGLPGNADQLCQEIERLLRTLEAGHRVSPRDLAPAFLSGDPASIEEYSGAVRAFKAQIISTAIAECGGHRARAAEKLGLHRSNLTRMIRDLDLEGLV